MVNRRLVLEAESAFQGAFPYLSNTPASVFQLLDHSLVALLILLNFISPEFHSRGGPFEQVTIVTVPEATLSEQDGPKARKRQIWFAGEISPVQLEAKPALVKATPQYYFWARIPSADTSHHPAANSRGNDVSH